jgi:arginase
MHNPRFVSAATENIAQKVYSHAIAGRTVLTLGGDHSIGIGTVAGTAKAMRERSSAKKDIAVIWVDAHADLNTPESSSSGNIHGMPLAFLTGLATSDREDIFGWIKDEHRVSFGNLVYIGLRDLDDSEKKAIHKNGIRAFSTHYVECHGIGQVLEMALAHIGPYVPIHLGFDIDALDPYWAPSTGMPTEQGLSLREGCVIAERLHQSGQLVAIDIVEVNPSINPADSSRTVRSGISIIKSALGYALV